ncbi:hypothetical protein RFI_05775 [Reticulomyxa filosa]|uniref:HhH-GPD domain-containing protein n=1 Tax=Reticulomyxa filosa TaxID=46433 RepID=X6NYF0_RETFI|nr:hypothetical protein RFI_05775 [Reticulomyxa filosa]|eukprot:ETO31345.1 hypothetical protein RFI_05775 [Reticulomyxa filosa]
MNFTNWCRTSPIVTIDKIICFAANLNYFITFDNEDFKKRNKKKNFLSKNLEDKKYYSLEQLKQAIAQKKKIIINDEEEEIKEKDDSKAKNADEDNEPPKKKRKISKQSNLMKFFGGKSDQKESNEPSQSSDEQQKDICIPMTAYSVWVSEIMLQQTRVETVISYFLKWMNKFPTVQSLASASLEVINCKIFFCVFDESEKLNSRNFLERTFEKKKKKEVNETWAGLGYYRRAKNLHLGAQKIVEEWKGEFPKDVKGLQQIPGIGQYTSGAIASIVYNSAAAAVDGNVVRVLSRLRAIACPGSPPLKVHWKLATDLINTQMKGKLVHDASNGILNQALMELGACICTPKSPNCAQCPVQSNCLAYRQVQSKVEPTTTIMQSEKIESASEQDSSQCAWCQPLPCNDIEELW